MTVQLPRLGEGGSGVSVGASACSHVEGKAGDPQMPGADLACSSESWGERRNGAAQGWLRTRGPKVRG